MDDDDPATLTEVEWVAIYAELAGDFYDVTLPLLERIAEREDVTELRVVFYFDN